MVLRSRSIKRRRAIIAMNTLSEPCDASKRPALRQTSKKISCVASSASDGERDKRYPVDGGVFDVPANSGEVVIPIHAELPIRKLAAFAVTIEKPGGVVVSARDRVVVLGAAG